MTIPPRAQVNDIFECPVLRGRLSYRICILRQKKKTFTGNAPEFEQCSDCEPGRVILKFFGDQQLSKHDKSKPSAALRTAKFLPRECDMCGQVFTPLGPRGSTCPECRAKSLLARSRQVKPSAPVTVVNSPGRHDLTPEEISKAEEYNRRRTFFMGQAAYVFHLANIGDLKGAREQLDFLATATAE